MKLKIECGDRYSQATTYHQLGNVAQKLREWKQAREYYQTALEICIEYGDGYSQARTYNNLGVIAKETGELAEAKANYLQTFQIWAEFEDTYSIKTFSIPVLGDLYRQTQDESILEEIAGVTGMLVEEVREMISQTAT